MGYTRPCKALARAKPVGRVLSSPLMISLLLQLAVVIVFQVSSLPGSAPAVGRISDDVQTSYLLASLCQGTVLWLTKQPPSAEG